jgi:hypothetical protein
MNNILHAGDKQLTHSEAHLNLSQHQEQEQLENVL